MSFSFLYKWALALGLLLGHVVTVFAQDANMDHAKHVYELFVADQGDSIHALLTCWVIPKAIRCNFITS